MNMDTISKNMSEYINNNTLQRISGDAIRLNWHLQADADKGVMPPSPYYDMIWNDWEQKHAEFIKNVFYPILKRFARGEEIGRIESYEKTYCIIQEDDKTLLLKDLNKNTRKQLHTLCDKLGLHHKANPQKNKIKDFWIYKPPIWLWEYTEKNPYSSNEESNAKQKHKKMIQRKKHEEYMSRKHCNECDANGGDTQLFCSVYIRGLYCEDCLETLSDGNGGTLSCHKFEPI